MNKLNLLEAENLILGFIGFEIGLRGMHPRSIKDTYLSSINRYFVENRIPNQFNNALQSGIIKFTLRGYSRIYYQMNPLAGLKKLAFTIELVSYLQPALSQYKPEWNIGMKRRAFSLALKFGIYFLLRKSEYLPSHDKKRESVRWYRIKFYDALGYKISWDCNDISRVKSMELNIHSSKTDQYGLGRIVRHTVIDGPNCICRSTFKWKIHCKNHLAANLYDGLFDTHAHGFILSDDQVAKVMKFIVRSLGWSDKRVSAHSLRYGGATMLAAAGQPQYVIEYFGGWAKDSKSLRVYCDLGNEAVSKVSQIMADGHNKSLEESRIRAEATRV